MFETDLDSESKSGAISTRLASTDDLSKHPSPYFEILLASTMLFSIQRALFETVGQPICRRFLTRCLCSKFNKGVRPTSIVGLKSGWEPTTYRLEAVAEYGRLLHDFPVSILMK